MEIPNPKPKKLNMVPKKPISILKFVSIKISVLLFLLFSLSLLKANHLKNTPLPISFSSHRITIPMFKPRREKGTFFYPKKEHYFY